MTFYKNNKSLVQVIYRGVTGICDMSLWAGNSNDDKSANITLISLYGSESQVKAISAAAATGDEIIIKKDKERVRLYKTYQNHIRIKTWRFGYGKYHALIWDEELITDCIIYNQPEKELEAWRRFLKTRRIPLLAEWITRIVSILANNGLITELKGHGINGWRWRASDDEVCDLIVKEALI